MTKNVRHFSILTLRPFFYVDLDLRFSLGVVTDRSRERVYNRANSLTLALLLISVVEGAGFCDGGSGSAPLSWAPTLENNTVHGMLRLKQRGNH